MIRPSLRSRPRVLATTPTVAGLAGLAIASAGAATAEVWQVEVLPAQSDAEIVQDVAVPFAGTLIGDYDAKTNPGGTRTVPGVFGGSGNNPIPYEASFGIDGVATTAPTGSFEFDWTSGAATALISSLFVDLVGAAAPELDVTLTIEFSTFRTFNPDSLFPGGTAIPVPLGTATLASLSATQTSAASLAIVPLKGGAWGFSGVVPVEIAGTLLVQEQPFELGPLASAIPISGTLVEGAGGIELIASFEGEQAFDQPIDGPFPEQLVPLPTILPPGGTANVIFSGTIERIVGVAGLSGTLVAASAANDPVGDLNGDGTVNGADLAIMLADWGDAGVPADLDGNGVVDGADLSILLGNWGAGA